VIKRQILENSVNSLLLNAYTLNSTGFMFGKAGISLVLFEISKYLHNELIEDHAFNLLREILTYDIKSNKLSDGKAGISFVLQYLIKYDLLDADYKDLYANPHKEIIGEIQKLEYNRLSTIDYIDYLFFIETTNYISRIEYNKSQKILSKYISESLTKFNRDVKPSDILIFYMYSTRLLYISNVCIKNQEIYQDFFKSIEQITKQFISHDICIEPLFAFQFYIYGISHKQEDNIMWNAIKMLENSSKNILIEALTLRQRIDIIISIFKVYSLDKNLDYRAIAYNIFNSMIDDDIVLFERKIVDIIYSKGHLVFGLGFGFSRLLLICIYWDKISQGIIPDNIIKLLI
jgi:hypothetical protein